MQAWQPYAVQLCSHMSGVCKFANGSHSVRKERWSKVLNRILGWMLNFFNCQCSWTWVVTKCVLLSLLPSGKLLPACGLLRAPRSWIRHLRLNLAKMRDERCEMGRARKTNTHTHTMFSLSIRSYKLNGNAMIWYLTLYGPTRPRPCLWHDSIAVETCLKFIKSRILSPRHRCPATAFLWTHLNLFS